MRSMLTACQDQDTVENEVEGTKRLRASADSSPLAADDRVLEAASTKIQGKMLVELERRNGLEDQLQQCLQQVMYPAMHMPDPSILNPGFL